MDYIYESIQMNNDLPINIFLHNAQFVEDHWHDSIELLFVLKGKVDVYIEKKGFTLQEEDVLIINSNEIHRIQSDENNLLLALQIPISLIKPNLQISTKLSSSVNPFYINQRNKINSMKFDLC